MTTITKIKGLEVDAEGLAHWLEREATTMHPLQFFREAVQNEIEAGATKIVIDGFKLNGQLLTRVSGDGVGMTPEVLVSHLATVMKTDKGEKNHGVGARIAALPANPAGVTFASRTLEGGEGMIKIIKDKHVYGLKIWSVEDQDADGDPVMAEEEVVIPEDGELTQIKATGTAVILHGTPWNSSLANEVQQYLARRYYEFPGNVSVNIIHPWLTQGTGGRDANLLIKPFGQTLNNFAIANGEVPFDKVAGLSGLMFWWLMPKPDEMKTKVGQNRIGYGIGSLVEDEIFDYSTNAMTDFGIPYKSAQSRIVILIAVKDAKMDTTRTSVVYPMGKDYSKRNTPWKALGAWFSEHMPKEIDNMMTAVMPVSSIFTDAMAKRMDVNWMDSLRPVKTIVSQTKGEPLAGNERQGATLPKGGVHIGPRIGVIIDHSKKPRVAAHRQGGGNKPGVEKLKVVTPRVQFVSQTDIPDDHRTFGIYWAETSNTVIISESLSPYAREIGYYVKKTGLTRQVVEAAVQNAYSLEYASYIIDANAQRLAGPMPPYAIAELKSDACLYAKALGCQSLRDLVEQNIKALVKGS